MNLHLEETEAQAKNDAIAMAETLRDLSISSGGNTTISNRIFAELLLAAWSAGIVASKYDPEMQVQVFSIIHEAMQADAEIWSAVKHFYERNKRAPHH